MAQEEMPGQMVIDRITSFQGGSGPMNKRGTVILTLNPIDKVEGVGQNWALKQQKEGDETSIPRLEREQISGLQLEETSRAVVQLPGTGIFPAGADMC